MGNRSHGRCIQILALQASRLLQSARHAETSIVVLVVGLVVVAVRRTHIRGVVVERPATQHTATRPSPSGIEVYQKYVGEAARVERLSSIVYRAANDALADMTQVRPQSIECRSPFVGRLE